VVVTLVGLALGPGRPLASRCYYFAARHAQLSSALAGRQLPRVVTIYADHHCWEGTRLALLRFRCASRATLDHHCWEATPRAVERERERESRSSSQTTLSQFRCAAFGTLSTHLACITWKTLSPPRLSCVAIPLQHPNPRPPLLGGNSPRVVMTPLRITCEPSSTTAGKQLTSRCYDSAWDTQPPLLTPVRTTCNPHPQPQLASRCADFAV